jgi:ORF6N domain
MEVIKSIQNRIYEIRGHRVMLDFDLAQLYEVETRVMNQTVKRNNYRFPPDFMFQLTAKEWSQIKLQSTDYQLGTTMSSQIVMTSGSKRPKIALPYSFTEHGVAMLASVLKSKKAVEMNIAIVRAFIALRSMTIHNHEILNQLIELRDRIGEHDIQLSAIYDALENMLDKKQTEQEEKEKWVKRQRIGFKK